MRLSRPSPAATQALYKPRSTTKFNNGNPIKWCRPTELLGADASGEKMALIKDGIEAGDVEQGELGDCYLLGAMSAIAAATDDSGIQGELFFKLLKQQDQGRRQAELRKGFCTFQLFKFGTWTEVTVDTLIPCDAKTNKPIFAHGKDPNELWVPLLEKAYAKLHGSFEALDGGSVTAALVDLTGGIAETLDLTQDDEVHDLYDGTLCAPAPRQRNSRPARKSTRLAAPEHESSLLAPACAVSFHRAGPRSATRATAPPRHRRRWKRMKRFAAGNAANCFYLLGSALANGDIRDDGKQSEVQMTDHNILVNHAYTVLQAVEVGMTDHGEKTRLLQLRNPWGMREWSGPWSDGSDEWKTKLGQKVQRDLKYEERDDGCFFISWDDFQNHFNRIYVCRVAETCDGKAFSKEQARAGARGPEGTWCKYEVECEWGPDTSGGCFNFPTWRNNPQFEMVVGQDTNAFFTLMQPDPRMDKDKIVVKGEGDEGGPKYDHKIGMYVMKGHELFRRKVFYDDEEIEGEDVIDSTPFMEYREVQCNTMDEEEEPKLQAGHRVVLCPSTFLPSKLGKFKIIVLTEMALAQPPTIMPPLKEMRCSGHWGAETAGGCRNFASWRKNVQYQLKLTKPARVSVLLMRDDHEAMKSHKPHGAGKKRTRNAPRKSADRVLFIGFVIVRPPPAHAGRRVVHVEDADVLKKTSYSPNFEVSRQFHTSQLELCSKYSPDTFIIVPTTFKPDVTGDYHLVVYTDDNAATLTPLADSTWHKTSARDEWRGRSAGGSRNHPSWVRNPLYSLRAPRETLLHLFLRQLLVPGDAPNYEGIGFYVSADDQSLDLRDVLCESGFRKKEEVHATFTLSANKEYLLIPMMYKKGMQHGPAVDPGRHARHVGHALGWARARPAPLGPPYSARPTRPAPLGPPRQLARATSVAEGALGV